MRKNKKDESLTCTVQISLVISDGPGISSTMLVPSHIAVLTTPLSRQFRAAAEFHFQPIIVYEKIIAEFSGIFKGIFEIP